MTLEIKKSKKAVVDLEKNPTSKKTSGISFYGTGRRKTSVARVWVKAGSGKIVVNKKMLEEYFPRQAHGKLVLGPMAATKTLGQYDVNCTVEGGGLSGQAGAIIHGMARALDKAAPEFHEILRKGGFLTRDSRTVERKKYGLLKARKKTPFKRR